MDWDVYSKYGLLTHGHLSRHPESLSRPQGLGKIGVLQHQVPACDRLPRQGEAAEMGRGGGQSAGLWYLGPGRDEASGSGFEFVEIRFRLRVVFFFFVVVLGSIWCANSNVEVAGWRAQQWHGAGDDFPRREEPARYALARTSSLEHGPGGSMLGFA